VQTSRKRSIRYALMEKQGGRCHLCGEEMDANADAHDDRAVTMDHLIPVSEGGRVSARGNLALAHRGCNRTRGSKPLPAISQPSNG